MVWLMRKCVQCGRYTLNQEKCPYCSGNVRIPHPARFSPQDKYARFRRAMKVELTMWERPDEGDAC